MSEQNEVENSTDEPLPSGSVTAVITEPAAVSRVNSKTI